MCIERNIQLQAEAGTAALPQQAEGRAAAPSIEFHLGSSSLPQGPPTILPAAVGLVCTELGSSVTFCVPAMLELNNPWCSVTHLPSLFLHLETPLLNRESRGNRPLYTSARNFDVPSFQAQDCHKSSKLLPSFPKMDHQNGLRMPCCQLSPLRQRMAVQLDVAKPVMCQSTFPCVKSFYYLPLETTEASNVEKQEQWQLEPSRHETVAHRSPSVHTPLPL
jgi:hypothetical protein